MSSGILILNHETITKKIKRMSLQVLEEFYHEKSVVIAGIEGEGLYLAGYLTEQIKKTRHFQKITSCNIAIDKKQPWAFKKINSISKDLKNENILLVDDVLNTGRTLHYALGLFQDIPLKAMKIAVLVDRNHTLYPIKADITGMTLSTTLRNHVVASLSNAKKMAVYLE